MTPTNNEWEEGLHYLILSLLTPSSHAGNPPIVDFKFWHNKEGVAYIEAKLTDFIRAEKQKSEAETLKKVLEVVEGMRLAWSGSNDINERSYNQALSDLTDKLTHLTKEDTALFASCIDCGYPYPKDDVHTCPTQ